MAYQKSLDWIHAQDKFSIKPGLERMFWVLEKLGNPQEKIKGIHVVGTNGKGSTVNNLQHIFSASGYEVGTFTSPFIMDFKERIAINGQMISEKDLVFCVNQIQPLAERLPKETDFGQATEFEIITLIMFLYFGQIHPVDIAIIEAGLGGTYDSTNVFQALAVICPSIGLDHQNILGDSYAEIASQKAGVIKGKEPVVVAIDKSQALAVFQNQADKCGANLLAFKKDFSLEADGQSYSFKSSIAKIKGIQPAMPGHHQLSNAALAIMTSLLLSDSYPKVTEKTIKIGISESYWLGRTELLADNLMIDGAHNNESVRALVSLLKEKYGHKRIHILFAAIDTKPIEEMLCLLENFDDLTVTSFDYHNAYPLDNYPSQYAKVEDVKDWLSARSLAKKDDFYVITGSLYFISQVRQDWFKQKLR
ncbi:bifunctional folylpolyglutamate synthase/dihydrofolate synthase [Streptococcus iniae]|nr:dihydrofolate synthase [Streptococcus iniae]